MRSLGIALFRYSVSKAEWQVLGVQKNYTYSFIEFVKLGEFIENEEVAAPLIKDMMIDEKVHLIKSTMKTLYENLHLKHYKPMYDTIFKKIKRTTWFYNAVTARSDGPTWELPKGRPLVRESGIETAMREFAEETSVQPSSYSLIGHKCHYTIYDNKEYHMTYYGAITHSNIVLNKSLVDRTEIKDVAWLNIRDLHKYPGGEHIAHIVEKFKHLLC